MVKGNVVLLVVGVLFLIFALIFAISPETLSVAVEEGEMVPQYDMPGQAVTTTMVTVPLLIIDLTIPQWSTVVMTALIGIVFLFLGLFGRSGGAKG